MDPKIRKQYEGFLNPEVLRVRILAAAVYVISFENFQDDFVDNIKFHYWRGYKDGKDIFSSEYQTEVLSKNKSPVYASLCWLQEKGAIDENDIKVFEEIKECRNVLSHELMKVLSSEAGLPGNYDKCFSDLVDLCKKIGTWWIVNYELPLNTEYDLECVDIGGIVPGQVMAIKLLYDIALGDEGQSRFYYEEFIRRTNPQK